MKGGLVKKQIIDKRGRRTTVWVKPTNKKKKTMDMEAFKKWDREQEKEFKNLYDVTMERQQRELKETEDRFWSPRSVFYFKDEYGGGFYRVDKWDKNKVTIHSAQMGKTLTLKDAELKKRTRNHVDYSKP